MNKLNVKKGDRVRIISGKDAGKEGKIMVTRHVKPRRQGEAGGRIEQAGTIHVSNVQLVCPSCKMPTRVGHAIVEKNGKKVSVRVCKQCGKQID